MACFVSVIGSVNPADELRRTLRSSTADSKDRFRISPEEFRIIPGSPFAYWVPHSVRHQFIQSHPFEFLGRSVKQGLATTDDFRFVRMWWETRSGDAWHPLLKGGSAVKFYADVFASVKWSKKGVEMKQVVVDKYPYLNGNPAFVVKNEDYYYLPGITWPLRGVKLAAQASPVGSIPSVAGKIALAQRAELPGWLAIFNSAAFDGLLRLSAGRIIGVQYEAGLMGRVPVPSVSSETWASLSAFGRAGWSARRSLDIASEVSHAFVLPAILQVGGGTFESRVRAWGERVAEVAAELTRVQSEIDELCFELYGISEDDRRAITAGFGPSESDDELPGDGSDDDDEAESEVELDPVGLAAGLVSWAVGVAVGRFDVRLATGDRAWPAEPDPFDPLPVCSPGMLTGDSGLPMSLPPEGYALEPSPVSVDDPGHELDLTARVRTVFDLVFGDQADAWWSDIGAALDPRNGVEGWLRHGFFDHHLKTYSKSRRKAPVMWPIGTASGSYRAWLYAHQVTDDTLFRVLGDVVEPKLAAEQRRLSDLTQEFGPSPSASQRRGLAAQQSLVDELIELRDQLRAVAPLWSPDLNDGTVIVLSPLWRLFAHHRAWSKELKERWGKLAKGEYDWAQLAMHIWPERVIPRCAADRSLAIAHDLEDTFWAQDATNADKWHPRRLPTTPIDQLIAVRTSPTIEAARNHPNP